MKFLIFEKTLTDLVLVDFLEDTVDIQVVGKMHLYTYSYPTITQGWKRCLKVRYFMMKAKVAPMPSLNLTGTAKGYTT